MKTFPNSPASPIITQNGVMTESGLDKHNLNHSSALVGLTKREYISTQIMAANLSNPLLLEAVTSGSILDGTAAEKCARYSVLWADELIKALNA